VIDVIGLQACPGQFLKEVVLFIAALGRSQDAEGVRAVLLLSCAQGLCRIVQGLLPACRAKGAVFAQQGFGEALWRMDELMQVPALGAEITLGDGVVFAGIGADDPVPLYPKVDSTATAAVVTDGHNVMHAVLSSRGRFWLIDLSPLRVRD